MDAIQALVGKILALNPVQAEPLASVLAQLQPDETADLSQYLAFCAASGTDLDFLAESYHQVVMDYVAEALYFKRHQRYRYATYAEVGGSVYGNPEYMTRYMYGVALTQFFWENHIAMRRYLRQTLPSAKGGRYMEIGPGHGFHMMLSLRHGGFDSYFGLDISPTSAKMTRDLLSSSYFGNFDKYTVKQGDLFEFFPESPMNALVMGEVLEHVEDPERFLTKIRDITAPDAYIMITTCIDAPAIDHIYLFTSMAHLTGIIEASGLRVKDQLPLPYPGRTLEQAESKRLPINVALVLEHRH